MGLSDKLNKNKINKKIVIQAKKEIPIKKINKLNKMKIVNQPKEIDIDKIAEAVEEKIKARTSKQQQIISEKIKEQRKPIKDILEKTNKKDNTKIISKDWIKTGISGVDKLFEKGIPKGTSVLLAGGAGSGKTIFCLQTLNNAAVNNEKCLYISLEEPEFRLKKHMRDFGWNSELLERKGLLKIKRVDPFKIAKAVEALLAKESGELKMKIEEIEKLIPEGFEPQWIVIDSLTALESAFKKEEGESYRIYLEQLFKYFEKLGVTSFLISETEEVPTTFSKSGVGEFLVDCVIVFYNIRHGNIRENAIEILKLRGAKHQKKIVPMRILSNQGIVVYPEQEVFSEIGEEK